jgi:nucleotide-binding universal stress UspA family protein
MKILLAVDGSDCSNAAVNEVAHRPWSAGSEVRIICAVEPFMLPGPEAWTFPDDYCSHIEAAWQERAQSVLNRSAAQFQSGQSAALQVTTEVIKGYPKGAILNEAERWGADLLVVGSHGYRGLKRLWLGSVSQAVATHAKCSVEIVHCRQASERKSAHEGRGEQR